ncbi:hypothetical protein [Emticicia sp. BO119]|uniref:hypothetical protein n=1 Tax=Emticicia sp. BO119 TaxID=2757768 RepID=UPI0017D6D045|nr:hypothetical protein [Emticicia sp. BO119]MBA4850508.1 hypothetical protein [Emticicia sp. BO119]
MSLAVPDFPLSFDNRSILMVIPEWIAYNAPDGLWLYSFLMWLILIWQGQRSLEAYLWFLAIILLAIGSEILQKFSRIAGTFDGYDLLAYCSAVILCTFQYYQLNTIPQ